MIPPLQPARPKSAATPAGATATGRGAADEPAADTQDQATPQAQQVAFNFQLQERAELLREFNELRALQMEQLKRDDEVVKKWIEMI